MTAERLARYFTRVHASNRHAGYGEPVEVLAASRQEAVSRAISLGWSGRREDARVTIDKVVDEAPVTQSVESNALHVIDTHMSALRELASTPGGAAMPDRLQGALAALRDVRQSIEAAS